MSSSEFRINEDKLIGPFFLSKKVILSNENGMIIDPDKFIDAFKSKVIMYLYEDEWELETPVREDIYQYIVNE